MTTQIDPNMLQLLALGAAVLILLALLLRIRFVGSAMRFLLSLALIAVVGILLIERAPFDPCAAPSAIGGRVSGCRP